MDWTIAMIKQTPSYPKTPHFVCLCSTLSQYCNTIKLCRSDANSFYLSAAQAIELAHRNQSDRKLINKRPDLTLLLQANWMASDNTTFFFFYSFLQISHIIYCQYTIYDVYRDKNPKSTIIIINNCNSNKE